MAAIHARSCSSAATLASGAAPLAPRRAAAAPVPSRRHMLQHPQQQSMQLQQQQQQQPRCATTAAAMPAPQRAAAAARVVRCAAGPDTASAGSSGAPEGQMSAELMASMEVKIRAELSAQHVAVSDVYGDGRHVNIDVVAEAFEGMNSVKRQRAVYKAIWEELQEAVHAVDGMRLKTPAEAAGSS